MEKKKFSLSLVMIFVVGMMNSYTYLMRDGTFASMHTGNLIKACFDIAEGKFNALHTFLVPILAFMLGIVTQYFLINVKRGTLYCALLICVSYVSALFIPMGVLNFLSVAILSYGIGIQLQMVRKVNGVDLATTMCTGNIRSMTERIAKLIKTKDKALILGIITYFSIIVSFVIGVTVGAVIVNTI